MSSPPMDEPSTVHTDSLPATADAREATELARSYALQGPSTTIPRPTKLVERWKYSIDKFWRQQVSVTVNHEASRDHLALERTFLAYLRTSLALSMMGVAVLQLFRLQQSSTPSPTFGFYVLGKPLSILCQAGAIFTLFIGASRTWRQQNAIVRGRAISGGFELVLIGVEFFLIFLVFFVLLIAVDAMKGD